MKLGTFIIIVVLTLSLNSSAKIKLSDRKNIIQNENEDISNNKVNEIDEMDDNELSELYLEKESVTNFTNKRTNNISSILDQYEKNIKDLKSFMLTDFLHVKQIFL